MVPSDTQRASGPGPSSWPCSSVIWHGHASLRELCHGFSCCNGKLVHLGVLKSSNKSTLSYSNEHCSSELSRDLFWSLHGSFRATGKLGIHGKRKFRFKNKLLSFDSTTITLCLSLFPWADFRRHKGGVKVHVLLDHGDYMPSFVHITEARMHNSKVTHLLSLPEGSIIVLDRAYIDFDFFRKWNEEKVFFVTRMKKNASYDVTEQLRIPRNSHVLKDEIIHLSGVNTWEKYPLPNRPAHESPQVRIYHNKFYLRAMVDRGLLQDPETEPEGQNLYRSE